MSAPADGSVGGPGIGAGSGRIAAAGRKLARVAGADAVRGLGHRVASLEVAVAENSELHLLLEAQVSGLEEALAGLVQDPHGVSGSPASV